MLQNIKIALAVCTFALGACASTPPTPTPAPVPAEPASSARVPPSESPTPAAASSAPVDPAELAKLEKECGDEDGGPQVFSCQELGDRFRDGKGVPKDLAKAGTYYRRSCDMSAPFGCMALARVLVQTDPSNQELFDLMLKSCAPGMLDVCHEFGDMWRDGKGVAKNEERARKLYETGCEQHQSNKKSCAETGAEMDCDPGLVGDGSNCRRLERSP